MLRITALSLSLMSLLFFTTTVGTSHAGEDCDCEPVWTIRAGAVLLDRSTPDNSSLVTDGFGGPTILNAQQFNFDTELGYELGLIRHDVFQTDLDVEFRYFDVDGWDAATPTIPAGSAVYDFATPFATIPATTAVSATYESQLQSMEINVRKQARDWLQVLAGFRYVQLNEQSLNIDGSVPPFTSFGSTSAKNSLYGFQLGMDALLICRGRGSLEGILKAGIYGNSASNATAFGFTPGPPLLTSSAADTEVAFVGEVGLTGAYQLTDRMSLRASYQILWTNGIATASEQVAVSDPFFGIGGIDNTDSPYYHGAFVGLQFDR